MNIRSQAILLALDHVSSCYPSQEPINIVEVGCMFNEDEGLSTYIIADFLGRRTGGDRFVTIDYDLSHIDASKMLIQKRNPHLSRFIQYRHGHSSNVLPEVLANLHQVHFFYLDGGAHPEVCLAEFEQAMAHLAPEGVILVDDAQQIPPSQHYRLPRPFGKSTLILPMLIVANYLRNREKNSVPGSKFIGQLENIDVPTVNTSDFEVIGSRHQMLAYGSSAFVAAAKKLSEAVIAEERELNSLTSVIKRNVKTFLSKYGWGT